MGRHLIREGSPLHDRLRVQDRIAHIEPGQKLFSSHHRREYPPVLGGGAVGRGVPLPSEDYLGLIRFEAAGSEDHLPPIVLVLTPGGGHLRPHGAEGHGGAVAPPRPEARYLADGLMPYILEARIQELYPQLPLGGVKPVRVGLPGLLLTALDDPDDRLLLGRYSRRIQGVLKGRAILKGDLCAVHKDFQS